MTDGPIGKAATALAFAVCVAGIVLPFLTPASDAVSIIFAAALLTLALLWASSD